MATLFSVQYYFGLEYVPGLYPPAQCLPEHGFAFAFTVSDSPSGAARPRTWWYTFAPAGVDLVVPPLALILAGRPLIPFGWGECRSEQDNLEPDQLSAPSATVTGRVGRVTDPAAGVTVRGRIPFRFHTNSLGRRYWMSYNVQFHYLLFNRGPGKHWFSIQGNVKYQGVGWPGPLVYQGARNP
jgi:hypothetical protein